MTSNIIPSIMSCMDVISQNIQSIGNVAVSNDFLILAEDTYCTITSNDGTEISGSMSVSTGATTTGTSGEVAVYTGDSSSDDNGSSGNLTIHTGAIHSTIGSSGTMNIYTGDSENGVSGSIDMVTGHAHLESGPLQIYTGSSDTDITGYINIFSGSSSGTDSGQISLFSGNATNGQSGQVVLATGLAPISGNISVITGETTADLSGTIILQVGRSSSAIGDIVLQSSALFSVEGVTPTALHTPSIILRGATVDGSNVIGGRIQMTGMMVGDIQVIVDNSDTINIISPYVLYAGSAFSPTFNFPAYVNGYVITIKLVTLPVLLTFQSQDVNFYGTGTICHPSPPNPTTLTIMAVNNIWYY